MTSDNLIGGAFLLVLVVLVALLVVSVGVVVTGSYHYEYRCTDGVTEQQFHALRRTWAAGIRLTAIRF